MRTLRCSDAGFDCKDVIRANTDEEVLMGASVHARDVHGLEATTEMALQFKAIIKEE